MLSRISTIRTFYTYNVPKETPRLTLDDGSTLIYRKQPSAKVAIPDTSASNSTATISAPSILPPPLRHEQAYPKLTESQIQHIQELRTSDPDLWTVKTLAKEFNTYPSMIMRIVRVPDDRREYLVSEMDKWWYRLPLYKKKTVLDRMRRKAHW
ncbi:hypothetical protein SeMB42_g00981 [Synchytrium endobioticum]|nr:hypothetical protein SeMB42_g00981 [Synchytrium endobioticum]